MQLLWILPYVITKRHARRSRVRARLPQVLNAVVELAHWTLHVFANIPVRL
jgi:hypothetical protein